MQVLLVIVALAALASPAAAQIDFGSLNDTEIIGLAAGIAGGVVVLLIMLLCCCYCCGCCGGDKQQQVVMQQPQRPVMQVRGPNPPARLFTRIFPYFGGPPQVREDTPPGGYRGPLPPGYIPSYC